MGDSSDHDRKSFPHSSSGKGDAEPTIVGGRPLTPGQLLKGIPRGIEVLIKKASIDPQFRAILLEKRAHAAAEIELHLSATETAMLNTLPAAQIEKIIGSTTVPTEHRRVFLGRAAAAMLSALAGVGLPGCGCVTGHRAIKNIRLSEMGPMKVSGTRVPLGSERLKVAGQEKWPNEVNVRVTCHSPFDSGELIISFREENGHKGKAISCQPVTVRAGKGQREAAFHATGTAGVTRWIQVDLANLSKDAPPASETESPPRNKYQAGEFAVKYRVITHVVEFPMRWIE